MCTEPFGGRVEEVGRNDSVTGSRVFGEGADIGTVPPVDTAIALFINQLRKCRQTSI